MLRVGMLPVLGCNSGVTVYHRGSYALRLTRGFGGMDMGTELL